MDNSGTIILDAAHQNLKKIEKQYPNLLKKFT